MFEKFIFSNNFLFRLSRHLVYWTLVFLYFSLPHGLMLNLVPYYVQRNIAYVFIDIISVYIIVFYLLPNLLQKKKYYSFVLYYLLILLVNLVIKETYYKLVEPKLFQSAFDHLRKIYSNFSSFSVFLNELYFIITRYFIVTLPAILIVFFKNWYYSNLYVNTLEKLSAENEISLLRSQLHPHFLFNTLNNIYSLAVEKSGKVPETIIKVSDILRYMLKEHNKKYVTLGEELNIIQAYAELEEMRYGDFLNVSIENNVDEKYYDIIKGPPLVLFTFVENAFKHGPNKSINKSWININMNYKNGIFTYTIENSKEPDYDDMNKDSTKNKSKNGFGLGLQNAKSTLYLFFQDKYFIDIKDTPESFKVKLKINYNK